MDLHKVIAKHVLKQIEAISTGKIVQLENMGLSEEQIKLVDNADPTHNKYVVWLARMFLEGKLRLPEDTQIISNAIKQFDLIKNKRVFEEEKDLNKYSSPGGLYKVLEKYEDRSEEESSLTKRLEKADSGAKLAVRGSGFEWYEITTAEAAHFMGSGTKWCTVPLESNYSKEYLEKGPLYILYEGPKPVAQVHFESKQFMDAYDSSFAKEDFNVLRVDKYEKELEALVQSLDLSYNVNGKYDLEAIAKNPSWAYSYARYVIKARWPEAEKAIASDPSYAYHYAKDVIGARWLEGEKVIAADPEWAYYYAIDIIKARWSKGEKAIASDPSYAYFYARDVIKARWSKAEKVIAADPSYAYYYAREVIKARWPEAEEAIAAARGLVPRDYANFLYRLYKGEDAETTQAMVDSLPEKIRKEFYDIIREGLGQ